MHFLFPCGIFDVIRWFWITHITGRSILCQLQFFSFHLPWSSYHWYDSHKKTTVLPWYVLTCHIYASLWVVICHPARVMNSTTRFLMLSPRFSPWNILVWRSPPHLSCRNITALHTTPLASPSLSYLCRTFSFLSSALPWSYSPASSPFPERYSHHFRHLAAWLATAISGLPCDWGLPRLEPSALATGGLPSHRGNALLDTKDRVSPASSQDAGSAIAHARSPCRVPPLETLTCVCCPCLWSNHPSSIVFDPSLGLCKALLADLLSSAIFPYQLCALCYPHILLLTCLIVLHYLNT